MKKHVTSVIKADTNSKKKCILALAAFCIAVLLIIASLIDGFLFPLTYFRAFASAPSIAKRGEGDLRIHFLDVGQGDCTVIELPDGKFMMVDGGNDGEAVRRSVLGHCKALGVKKFDYILLTHPESDHAGGLDDVLRCFGAEVIFLPYTTKADGAYSDFLAAANEEGAECKISQTYEYVCSEQADEFYFLLFLSPLNPSLDSSYYNPANAEDASSEDVNDASAIVYFEYAGRSLLLTGDASSKVEDKLVEDYETIGKELFSRTVETAFGTQVLTAELDSVDFLKAGHHGSSGSTGEALAALCRPKAAFVSCGAGNGYGHPSLTCAENILSASPDAEIYRTDELGNIMLTIHSDGSYEVTYAAQNTAE